MDAPPVVQPSIPSPPPPRSGCSGKGCLAAVVAGILLLVLGIAGGWFAFNYIVRTFTAAQAASIQIEQVSAPQMQLAESKMNTLRSAIRNRQESTIQFTAADLNALVANDPGFRGARGRAHFAIANSTVSLDLSVPLTSVPWKIFRSRWFNGRVQFGVSYVDDNFSFDLKSAEANGHDVPRAFFTPQFSRSFNRSFNDSFHRQSSQHRQDVFWRNLKMISVQDDKLIVTTRGM
jgi:hypothetical protein